MQSAGQRVIGHSELACVFAGRFFTNAVLVGVAVNQRDIGDQIGLFAFIKNLEVALGEKMVVIAAGGDLQVAVVQDDKTIGVKRLRLLVDLSLINMEKLRDEFAKKVKRKATVIEDIRQIVEEKLAQMLAANPLRMNYEKKYQEIIAAYNQDKDRATVEDTFAQLMDLANSLSAEQHRAVNEGLSEDQLALFDLVRRDDLSKADRERIKQASKELLAGVLKVIAPLDRWTEKEQTQAEVETFILDHVYQTLPEPPYTSDDKVQVAQLVYRHIWQQSVQDQLSRLQ